MKTTSFSLIFIFFSVFALGQIKEKAAVDRIFSRWDQSTSPGCALGIIKDGKLIYARGYGMANLEYNQPNSPKSVFRIASTSKQFTAACIVLLSEQGKLKLDHTLKQFFPAFPAYANKITIRHLLNHTSGIRDYLVLASLKGLEGDDFYTDEDIMQWLVNQKELNFAPGEEHLYSNSGYWLLGQIVNKVAKMNMADFAQKEIFKPLGMTQTHFHNDHTKIVKNRASGYMPKRKGGYRISMTTLDMIGDGGIFTTIEDIKKWDDAFYESKVLSKQFWNKMTQQGVLNNGNKIDYASGLSVSAYKGLKTISHGGAFVGFRAQLIRFPEQRFSVAILANRADANPTGMAYQVAEVFLKNDFVERATSRSGDALAHKVKVVKLSKKALKKFSGYYWNAERAYSRRIYLKNDTLRYLRSFANESSLIPIGNNKFKMNVRGNAVVRFDKTPQGNYAMVFVSNGQDVATSQAYIPKTYSKEALQKFTGNYYSSELDINYELRLKNGALTLFMDGQEVFSITPVMENLFANPRLGTLHFKAGKSGQIKAFKLASGRVKNLSFVKQ